MTAVEHSISEQQAPHHTCHFLNVSSLSLTYYVTNLYASLGASGAKWLAC